MPAFSSMTTAPQVSRDLVVGFADTSQPGLGIIRCGAHYPGKLAVMQRVPLPDARITHPWYNDLAQLLGTFS